MELCKLQRGVQLFELHICTAQCLIMIKTEISGYIMLEALPAQHCFSKGAKLKLAQLAWTPEYFTKAAAWVALILATPLVN